MSETAAVDSCELPSPQCMDEDARLAHLDKLDILDTPGEESYDRVTRLVRQVFDVPMSTVSFIDGHRQWYKSHDGVSASWTERQPALCYYAVRQQSPLIVRDATKDARFARNRFVVGEPHIRFYAGYPVCDPSGICVGILCAMDTRPREFSDRDADTLGTLARLVTDLLALRSLATSDPLTGANNRRGFMSEASRAVALAQRHKHDLSIIALDIDHFKCVNDAHGHGCGDEVIADSIRACQYVLRKTDMIGRLGGEEFAVVLPFVGASGALTTAEALRAAIAGQEFDFLSGSVKVTASFGVASLGARAIGLKTLLQQADAALYRAKATGRNCVVAVGGGDQAPAGGRRVLKAGKIIFNSGGSVVDCTVRRLAETSAIVDVATSAGLPERFKLSIESERFSRVCQVSAKSEGRIEVVFA